MKKVYLSILGFALVCRMGAYAQTHQDTVQKKPPFSLYTPVESSGSGTNYDARELHIDEVNFVSSYYSQTGDHSPVTGGIGTENVTDMSNGLTVNLAWSGGYHNNNTLAVGLGFDHHTSASAAYVALNGGSNPSGTRIYPSLDWTLENPKTGGTFGIGAYYSGEYNYKSKGLDFHWSTKTNDKNGEFGVKLQGYFDKVTMILPSEFVPKPAVVTTQPGTITITTASGNTEIVSVGGGVISNSKSSLPTSGRTTGTLSLSYSQIINSRLQIMFLGDVVAQQGYLGLPFHRVYFNTGKDTIEKLPSSRFKLPIGIRANYFVGDNLIFRTYYRYYLDNWGTRSNTASIELAYKITPFFSLSPFFRYYDQTAARYFAPYEAHTVNDQYYTSNYEYANLHTNFYGVGIRVAPPKGVFGWQNLHEMEIRYGHYSQSTNLVSDVISVSFGFK